MSGYPYRIAAKIAGELRMKLDKPTNLSSIDIWVRYCSFTPRCGFDLTA
jgi:hypothetical protein